MTPPYLAAFAPALTLWKLALATWMRDAARAKNGWLSDRLVLGHPCLLSRNLTRYRCLHQHSDPTWARLTSTFATWACRDSTDSGSG